MNLLTPKSLRRMMIGASFLALFALAQATHAASWAYVTLSRYWGMPSDPVNVSGAGFEPEEQVTVSFAGATKTVTANSSGSFTAGDFHVPMSAVASTQPVVATGNKAQVRQAKCMSVRIILSLSHRAGT